MNEIHLSDVLTTDYFRTGTFNLIVAPCGCGKSQAAINIIAPLASSPSKALYLIDTKNGCRRIANEKGMALPCLFYESTLNSSFPYKDFDETKVVVTTYAQFGAWCAREPHFADNFEVIICDEAHNIVQFSYFGEIVNFAATARDNICAAVWRGKALVVGITATSDFLKHLLCPITLVPVNTSNLKHYTENRHINYASIHQLLRQMPTDQRGALYVAGVQQMKELAAIARECGHNPLCIWSYSYKEPMTNEQLEALSYLIEKEEVPPEYDLFMMNASCETAINIRSHMDYFIVHNTNPTHITQARGRYRGNLDTLYLLDKEKGTIHLPPTFLNHPLFKEDKALLRQTLNIKDNKGRLITWEKLFQLLKASGYCVTKGRERNRPYLLIREP